MIKKLIALSVGMTLMLSSSVFASSSTDITKNQQVDSPKKEKALKQEDVEALVKKYNLEFVSEDEVKRLNLQPQTDSTALQFESVNDLENYIVKQQKEFKNKKTFEHDVHLEDSSNMDTRSDTSLMLSATAATSGTNTVTTTKSYTHTDMADLTVRSQVACTYKYDWTDYPGEPLVKFNYRYTSCGSPEVFQTSSPGYNRLDQVTSNSAYIYSSTRIKHTFTYKYSSYIYVVVGPGNGWIKVGSGTVTNTVNYYIP